MAGKKDKTGAGRSVTTAGGAGSPAPGREATARKAFEKAMGDYEAGKTDYTPVAAARDRLQALVDARAAATRKRLGVE